MKILLTQPLFDSQYLLGKFNPGANANTFLYGQACLAAVAREAGYDVTILDPYTPEEYKSYLKEHKFDVVGCTIYTLTYNLAKKLFEYTRAVLPEATLVAGGPHPTSLPEGTLKDISELDYVVYGEGEKTFIELLSSIDKGMSVASIDGIAYRDKESNSVGVTQKRCYIEDLDELPMASYDLFPMKSYVPTPNVVKRYPTYAIQVTRGCPYQCSFCQFNLALGKKYRHRSVDKVIDELLFLKNQYGARGIIFRDSTLTVNVPFLKSLCQAMIDKNVNLKWMCYSRTDVVAKHYKELLPLMKKAGCWQIGFGCESANQKSLDMLKKGTKVEDNIVAVKETMKAGLMCSTTWMICLPGENEEEALKTVRLAKKLSSHVVKFFLPLPFPNTDLEAVCKADGGMRDDISYDDYDLIMPDRPIYVNPLIGADKMKKMLKRAYLTFYTNPRVLLKNLATIRDFDMMKKYWAFARMIHL